MDDGDRTNSTLADIAWLFFGSTLLLYLFKFDTGNCKSDWFGLSDAVGWRWSCVLESGAIVFVVMILFAIVVALDSWLRGGVERRPRAARAVVFWTCMLLMLGAVAVSKVACSLRYGGVVPKVSIQGPFGLEMGCFAEISIPSAIAAVVWAAMTWWRTRD